MRNLQEDAKVLRVVVVSANANRLAPGSIAEADYEAECSARIDEMTALCESEHHFTNLATGETWTEPYEGQP